MYNALYNHHRRILAVIRMMITPHPSICRSSRLINSHPGNSLPGFNPDPRSLLLLSLGSTTYPTPPSAPPRFPSSLTCLNPSSARLAHLSLDPIYSGCASRHSAPKAAQAYPSAVSSVPAYPFGLRGPTFGSKRVSGSITVGISTSQTITFGVEKRRISVLTWLAVRFLGRFMRLVPRLLERPQAY